MADPQRIRTEIRIFIASPGGLDPERQIAFDVVARINRTLARQLGVYVDIFGWEQEISAYDRPQAAINKNLEKCDFFIGVIWDKWGTPSGEASSGFAEELNLAKEMLDSGRMKAGWLFFKKLSDEAKKYPSPAVSKVLEFQDSIRNDRTFLYKSFANPEDWDKTLYDDLIIYLSSNYLPQLEINEVGTISKEQPDEGVKSLNAGEALSKISASLAAKKFDEITEFQLARGKLAIEAISFSQFNSAKPNYIEIKTLNDLYENTVNPDLSSPEKYILLLTLLADKDDLKMGWFWQPCEESKLLSTLIAIAEANYPTELRIKALSLLHDLDIRQFRILIRSLLVLGIGDLNEGIFELIAADPKPEDEAWLRDCLKNGAYTKKTCWKALFKLLKETDPAVALQLILDTPDEERGLIDDLTEIFGRVDDSFAKALLDDPDSSISLAAFNKLKNSFSDNELLQFIIKESGTLAAESIIELCQRKIPIPEALIDKLYSQPVKKTRTLNSWSNLSYGAFGALGISKYKYVPKEEIVRLAVNKQKTRAALESKIGWSTEGAQHYAALISQNYQELKDQFLTDIENQFYRFKQPEVDRIKTEYPNKPEWLERAEDSDGYYRGHFLKYSLPVLEENFEPANLPLVKRLYVNPDAGNNSNEVSEVALRILRQHGSPSDIPVIKSRLASLENSSLKLLAMRTILDLTEGSKADLLIEFLKFKTGFIVRELLNYSISENIIIPIDDLVNRLYDDDESIRLYVLGYIVATYSAEIVADLIPRYRMGTDDYQFYFYNVVCWLDRVSFAPELLKGYYTEYLQTNLRKDSDGLFA